MHTQFMVPVIQCNPVPFNYTLLKSKAEEAYKIVFEKLKILTRSIQYTNNFLSLGFSGLILSVFIARNPLTCPGATWVGERQWA
ncbi:hypothetical protein ANTPLA_LOCUS539 [Anthophora plagiata]